MAAPARLPQVVDYNYEDIDPTDDDRLARGFGMTPEAYKELKKQFESVFLTINPGMIPYKNSVNRAQKAAHVKQFYDHFHQFAKVPEGWKEKAITHIFTNLRSNKQRRKGESKSGDDPQPQSKKRKNKKYNDDENDIDDHVSKQMSRLDVNEPTRVAEWVADRGAHATTQFIFCDSATLEEHSKLNGLDIVESDGHTISLDAITEEIKAWDKSSDGFNFQHSVFLSPRPDQSRGIRTQRALEAALRTIMPGSKVYVTTEVLVSSLPPDSTPMEGVTRTDTEEVHAAPLNQDTRIGEVAHDQDAREHSVNTEDDTRARGDNSATQDLGAGDSALDRRSRESSIALPDSDQHTPSKTNIPNGDQTVLVQQSPTLSNTNDSPRDDGPSTPAISSKLPDGNFDSASPSRSPLTSQKTSMRLHSVKIPSSSSAQSGPASIAVASPKNDSDLKTRSDSDILEASRIQQGVPLGNSISNHHAEVLEADQTSSWTSATAAHNERVRKTDLKFAKPGGFWKLPGLGLDNHNSSHTSSKQSNSFPNRPPTLPAAISGARKPSLLSHISSASTSKAPASTNAKLSPPDRSKLEAVQRSTLLSTVPEKQKDDLGREEGKKSGIRKEEVYDISDDEEIENAPRQHRSQPTLESPLVFSDDDEDQDAPLPRRRMERSRRMISEDEDDDNYIGSAQHPKARRLGLDEDEYVDMLVSGRKDQERDISVLEESSDEEAGDDSEQVKNESDAEAAIRTAVEFANSQSESKTALLAAAHNDHKTWTKAAAVWQIPINKMRVDPTAESPYISLPPEAGLNPAFSAMPHQLVCAAVQHNMVFGDKLGNILADEMGLGKSVEIILTWVLNFTTVLNREKITWLRKGKGAQFPTLDDKGCLHGVPPKIGATFFSANTSGVTAFAEAFALVMKNSLLLNALPEEWRPKLVLLYDNAERHMEPYGGQEAGLYTKLTPEEWAEIMPAPDFDKNARYAVGYEPPAGIEKRPNFRMQKHPQTWPKSPNATFESPSPTSTRFIVVSTNPSWVTRVSYVPDIEKDKQWKDAHKTLADYKKAFPKQKTRPAQLQQAIIEVEKDHFKHKTKKRDGSHNNQANRVVDMYWTEKGQEQHLQVRQIVDLFYASWVAVDELQNASSADTLTYTQIITPITNQCDAGVTGISGSPFANGIMTTVTFASKALWLEQHKESSDESLRDLASLNPDKFLGLWNDLLKSCKRSRSRYQGKDGRQTKKQREQQDAAMKELFGSPQYKPLFRFFAGIIQHYFIQRRYTSKDPWGTQLRLVKGKLEVTQVDVKHPDEYHAIMVESQTRLKSYQHEQLAKAIQDWEDNGEKGPKPKELSDQKAHPQAYLYARIVAVLPNLPQAIKNWQEDFPAEGAILGDECEWGESLSNNNEAMKAALDHPIGSFLDEIALEACEGSAKWKYIKDRMDKLQSETTTGTRKGSLEDVTYQSKAIIVSNIRVVRTVLWLALRHTYGAEHVIGVADKQQRDAEIPKWRAMIDVGSRQKPKRGVYIMCVGMKVISQSITLTEGHLLIAADPTSQNTEAVQVQNRQYRIGQESGLTEVIWLKASGSDIEANLYQGNMTRNAFAGTVETHPVEEDATEIVETLV